jgi:hypothetical protein
MKYFLPVFFLLSFGAANAQTFRTEYHINDTLTRQQNFHAVCRFPWGDIMATENVWDTVDWPYDTSRVALIKMDSAGNIKWSKYLDAKRINSIDICEGAGGVYLLNYGNGFYVSVLRADTAGNAIWMRHVFAPSSGYFCDAQNCVSAPGGGCYVTGHYLSLNTNEDLLWVMKFDPGGNIVWSNIYQSPGAHIMGYSPGIKVTNNGSIVFPYYFHQPDSLNNEYYALGLIKLDSAGNTLWNFCYADTNTRIPLAFEMLQDSSFMITGQAFITNSINPHIFLVKTDKHGNLLRSEYIDHESNLSYGVDREALLLMSNGNILLGNTYPVSTGVLAGELLEFDTAGTYLHSVRIGGVFQDSTAIVQLIQSDNDVLAFGARFTEQFADPNFPTFHPMVIRFNSVQNTFCDEVRPPVNTVIDTLRTDHPQFTTLPGSVTGFMTPVGVIPFDFWSIQCVQNGVEDVNNLDEVFSVYPDPSDGSFVISRNENNLRDWTFEVTDISGKIIYRSGNISQATYPYSNSQLSAGIYFVRVIADGKNSDVKKLVIAR